MEEELEEQEEDIRLKFLVPRHPSNNIEITNYFNNDPKFNGVFLRKNLHRIKDEAYVINLDHKNSKGTHWVSLFIDRNTALYFDSFGIKYIPLNVLNKIKDKSITHNIFRLQNNECIINEFCCTGLIGYMIPGKTLLDYTNLFSPNDYKKSDEVIFNYFKDKYGRRSKYRV